MLNPLWEFPKHRDPPTTKLRDPPTSRAFILRTPRRRTPIYRNSLRIPQGRAFDHGSVGTLDGLRVPHPRLKLFSAMFSAKTLPERSCSVGSAPGLGPILQRISCPFFDCTKHEVCIWFLYYEFGGYALALGTWTWTPTLDIH